MPRFLAISFLCCLGAAARAQGPAPEKPPAQDLGGSTEKATLVLNPSGHVGEIRALFFTPDGKQVISVGADKTVQFWDTGSGERLQVLRLPATPTAAALSPDGKTLAVGRWVEKGRRAYLVNLDDGRILWLSAGGGDVLNGYASALAFSPDGDRLAGGYQGYVWAAHGGFLWDGMKGIWEKKPADILKGRAFTSIPGWPIPTIPVPRCLAFSPDGKRIAVGCDQNSLQNNKISLAFLAEVPVGDAKPARAVQLPISGHARFVGAVTWTPDGQQAVTVDASVEHRPSVVQFWSVDGKLQKQHQLGAREGAELQFLNAKELLLTWFTNGGDKKVGPRGHGQSILSLTDPIDERKGPFVPGAMHSHLSHSALSADGKLAAFSGGSQAEEIVIWDVAAGKQLHHLGGKLGTPQSVGWSKDGSRLGFHAVQQDKKQYYKEALDLKEMQLLQTKVDRSDYLDKYRSNGDWSIQPRQMTPKDIGNVFVKHGDTVTKVDAHGTFLNNSTLSPAGEPRWLAWSTTGWFNLPQGLHLGDLSTGKRVTNLTPWPQYTTDLAPSPDGRFLIAAARDHQMLFIYRIADEPARTDRRPLLNLFVSQGDWILWTKEGYYAASPNGERLMGWTVESGPDRLPTFHPAERFRKRLYRPDVIKLVFVKGTLADALKAADAAAGTETRDVKLDQLVPPRALLAVVDQNRLPTVKLKVRAEASSAEQPITALRLMMDGRVVPGEGTRVEFAKGQAKAEVEWTFVLPEGEHQLAVLARGPDSSAVSPALRLKHVDQQKLPALHVLTVGIDRYRDKALNLAYAAADAQALAAAFAKHCKGEPFREVNSRTILNAQATTPEIVQELAALRKQVSQQDLLVVFFACHGVKHQKDYYLLTHEADIDNLAGTALSGDALRKALSGFKCQVLLMLDACHSSGFGAGKRLARAGMKAAGDDVARDLTEEECGIAVMCAAMGHETAEETSGHGLFTRAVLEALEKRPGVPYNRRNQRMYVHHLHSFVFDEVSSRSEERQHPFLSLPWVVESFVIR